VLCGDDACVLSTTKKSKRDGISKSIKI
jgi:hypothetical protein